MKQYLIAEDTPSMSFEDLAHAGLLSPGPTHAVIHCRVRDLHHSIYAYVSPDGSGFLQASNVPCQELVPWRNARGVITGLTCYGKWPERHRASKLYFVPSRGDFVCKSCGNVRYECQFVGRTIRRVPVEVLHHQYDGGGGLQPTKVNVSKDGSTTIEVWRSGWTFSVQS